MSKEVNIVRSPLFVGISLELKKIAASCPHKDRAECSGLQLWTEESHMRDYFHDQVEPGDLVISFDYWTDELKGNNRDEYPGSECEDFVNWINSTLWRGAFHIVMAKFGYEEVAEHDGSGGGLYYGASLFRKPKTGKPTIRIA